MLLRLRLLSALVASQSCGLHMADTKGAEEGPVPLDDGPVEDEVFEDMDGDDRRFCFDLLFFPRFSHQGTNWPHICKCYNKRYLY